MKAPRCNKFLRRLFRDLRRQGWEWEKTGGNHVKFTAPSGAIIFTSSSPSDVRAQKNLMSQLKRIGGYEPA